ncbi:hypothetical protein H0274_11210 [Altererythrobacter sp. CC-YST694]|uniref:hypothetical protein n=1 Tax=Altererythrobacter sp. CC-YST694 TaxID=2755038 RepID=UPI001D002330|nr:hypothetical protein [Altererythrobacter sp. CC-YST694]MCB5425830.1 hypothetical protein [Altererythrobacter sp. CC-YST694]
MRFAFYFLYYLLTALTARDFKVVILTFPMFAAILFATRFTSSKRIDYIDAVSIIYFIAFVIVPLQKVEDWAFPTSLMSRGFPYPEYYFIIVSALALFSYITLTFFMRRSVAPINKVALYTPPAPALIFVGIGVFLTLVAIAASGSVGNLLASRYARESTDVGFIVPITIAALSINATFTVVRKDPNPIRKAGTILIACACLLFVCNPLNTARFFLLGAWIPVLATLAPVILNPFWFYLAIPFTFLFVLPVLNITTRFSTDRFSQIQDLFASKSAIFEISYFDLLEAGCDAIRYVERYGHENGGLFVSTVLSFFPRSLWPGKPINSGLLVGYMNDAEGLGNTNLAVPWFMDGYMDFGIIGGLVYAFLLAITFGYVRKNITKTINGIDVFFLLFLANIAIITRGTLAVTYILILFQTLFLLAYQGAFARAPGRAPRSRMPRPAQNGGRSPAPARRAPPV